MIYLGGNLNISLKTIEHKCFLKPNFCHYHWQGHIASQVFGMCLCCAICWQSVKKKIRNISCEVWGAWPEGCNISTQMWIKIVPLQVPCTNGTVNSRREQNGNNGYVSPTEIISSQVFHLSHSTLKWEYFHLFR